MKKPSAVLSLALNARRANLPQTIAIVTASSVVLGMLFTDTTDQLVAYLVVSVACCVPIALWIGNGSNGIPILPVISLMSFIYYALPILRKQLDVSTTQFEPSEILSAAVTVATYLSAATISWWMILGLSGRRSPSTAPDVISGSWLRRIIFVGLALGVLYHVALYSGSLGWLGPAFGLARSAMLSTATVACFVLGHARAQGSLRGQQWVLAVVGLAVLVLLAWASLFLINGMVYCLAAIFGYVITSRRVPWVVVSASMAVIIVLHAGKDSMRDKYWYEGRNYGEDISVTDVPGRMAEWTVAGLETIGSGKNYSSAVDRASLLSLLLQVQRLTPDYVPPLEGESYEVLPEMLVPRFLYPDKIDSQAAMSMLNIRFGFQTREGTQSTAIGWGLIAEGYANFGRLGVIGVALILGLLCGGLERWSVDAPIISLPSLVAVTAMIVLIDLEGDAAGLATTLFQSIISVAILFWCFKSLAADRRHSLHPADVNDK
jgi:hypothetical protein